MNARVKKLWIDALRSGHYEQCSQVLRLRSEHGVKHCCLGVLTDLYEKDTGQISTWRGGTLPVEVMRWAELNNDNPVLIPPNAGKGPHAAVSCNDILDLNFKQIASLIEANL